VLKKNADEVKKKADQWGDKFDMMCQSLSAAMARSVDAHSCPHPVSERAGFSDG